MYAVALMTEGEGERERGCIRIPVDTAGAADVDNHSGFIIFDAEIRGCGLDEFEGGCGMNGNDGIPLLIRELFFLKKICKWRAS